MKVAAEGGRPFRVSDLRGDGGCTWLRDGTIVFAPMYADGLYRVPADGGTATRLTTPDASAGELGHWWPDALPGERHIVFTAFRTPVDQSRVGVLDTSTGNVSWVVDGGFFGRYVPPGYLVYARGQRLYAVPFDATTATVKGPPVAVLDDLLVSQTIAYGMFAVSSRGTLAYVTESLGNPPRELVWLDRTGRATPAVPARRRFLSVSLSPDDRMAASRFSARAAISGQPRSTGARSRLSRRTRPPNSIPSGRATAASSFTSWTDRHSSCSGWHRTHPTRGGRLWKSRRSSTRRASQCPLTAARSHSCFTQTRRAGIFTRVRSTGARLRRRSAKAGVKSGACRSLRTAPGSSTSRTSSAIPKSMRSRFRDLAIVSSSPQEAGPTPSGPGTAKSFSCTNTSSGWSPRVPQGVSASTPRASCFRTDRARHDPRVEDVRCHSRRHTHHRPDDPGGEPAAASGDRHQTGRASSSGWRLEPVASKLSALRRLVKCRMTNADTVRKRTQRATHSQ